MTDVVLSGVTFSPDDFSNYGWLTAITVSGSSYIRVLGLFAAGIRDIGLGLQTTATSTHNLSTMIAGDAVTVTLAANRAYSLGATITVAYDATNYFTLTATATCTTTSLVGTVAYVLGSGSHSAWTVSGSGVRGATGAAGPSYWSDNTISATSPITAANKDVIHATGTSAQTVNLPAGTSTSRVQVWHMNTTADVTVTPNGTEHIYTSLTAHSNVSWVINFAGDQGAGYQFDYDGTAWRIKRIGSTIAP